MTCKYQLFFWSPCIRQCMVGRWSTSVFLKTSVKTILSAHGTKYFNYCFLISRDKTSIVITVTSIRKGIFALRLAAALTKLESSTNLQDYILKISSEGNEPEWREREKGIFSTVLIAAGLVWKLGTLSDMMAHTVYGVILYTQVLRRAALSIASHTTWNTLRQHVCQRGLSTCLL